MWGSGSGSPRACSSRSCADTRHRGGCKKTRTKAVALGPGLSLREAWAWPRSCFGEIREENHVSVKWNGCTLNYFIRDSLDSFPTIGLEARVCDRSLWRPTVRKRRIEPPVQRSTRSRARSFTANHRWGFRHKPQTQRSDVINTCSVCLLRTRTCAFPEVLPGHVLSPGRSGKEPLRGLAARGASAGFPGSRRRQPSLLLQWVCSVPVSCYLGLSS